MSLDLLVTALRKPDSEANQSFRTSVVSVTEGNVLYASASCTLYDVFHRANSISVLIMHIREDKHLLKLCFFLKCNYTVWTETVRESTCISWHCMLIFALMSFSLWQTQWSLILMPLLTVIYDVVVIYILAQPAWALGFLASDWSLGGPYNPCYSK